MTKDTLVEELDNALSYANQHGKDGKWSYDILVDAVANALVFLNQESVYRKLIGE
jgi:hypothetical protein